MAGFALISLEIIISMAKAAGAAAGQRWRKYLAASLQCSHNQSRGGESVAGSA